MPRHPDITRWADYVRGLASGAERNRMRRHLDAGCRPCAGRVAALERIAAVARIDTELAPPAAVLHSVKALMALHQPRPERRSWLGAAAFDLLRDTAVEPALQGARSGDSSGRHVVFGAAAWVLDLSVEPTAAATARALSGSCLRRGGEPVAGAAVLAVSGGRIADGAETDELGEFVFEGLPAEECELWLFADSSAPLVAALDLSS